MSTFSITYDLRNPGRDYDKVISKIKSLGSWCRPTESAWFVNTNSTASEIRDAIASVADSNDKIMVHSVAENWACRGLSNEVTEWLKSHWTSACNV